MMDQGIKPVDIHYIKLGKGEKILLAFHGIGQNARDCFSVFETYLGANYTIYAFDLPYHGKSAWKLAGDVRIIEIKEWMDFLTHFLNHNKISKFDVAGFSIGGRFALATAAIFPDKIINLFLIAPDGLNIHPLYRLATHNTITRAVFRLTMSYPGLILNPAKLFANMGILPSTLLKFLDQLLAHREKRNLIYYAWNSFSKLQFKPKELLQVLEAHNIKVKLFLGKNDYLIPPHQLQKTIDLMTEGHVHILPCGHFSLVSHTAAFIKNEPL